MFVCIRENKWKSFVLKSILILVNKEEKELFEKKKDPSGGQFVNPVDDPNKTLSQAKAKVLQNVDTFFYIGTEVCLSSIRNLFFTINRVNIMSTTLISYFKRNNPGRRFIVNRRFSKWSDEE